MERKGGDGYWMGKCGKKKKKRDMVDRRYLTFFSFQIRLINENWNRIPMFPSIER